MIASELAKWIVADHEVPAEVERAALRHLLDGVGNAVAGLRSGAAEPAIKVATELGGPGESTILGTAVRVSAPAAGLANGTLVHALDFDDTHAGGLVHATAVVLPAAFSVGEQMGATGRELVEAAVVGYEVACRTASAAPHGFHAGGLHATMVAGVFSSAAVAARLMGLDPDTTASALGIAGSQAGGLLAFLATGASTKQLHPGFASQSGIIAARLAAAGATGPNTVFDGPHGVYEALASSSVAQGSLNRSVILDALGETWETQRIGIKPWPTCQLSHATMAAVVSALRPTGINPDHVKAVHARVHPDSAPTVCADDRDLTRPASGYAAKFSLPWSVAALIIDGRVGVETYAPSSLSRAEVTELASRVTWEVTDDRGVAADAQGHVVVTLDDGSEISGHVPRSPGGGASPLTDDELYQKFAGNVGPCAPELAAVVTTLPTAPDLRELMTLAARAAATTKEESC